jgi:hypothetical protein
MVMDTCVWLRKGRVGKGRYARESDKTVTESEERDADSTGREGTDVREVETCPTGLSVVCSI